MARLKMRGSTPRFDQPSLCDTCGEAIRINGAANNESIVICEAVYNKPIQINFKVTECNAHREVNKLALYEMRKIAHIMVFKKGLGFIGFKPAMQFLKDEGLTPDDAGDLTPPTGIPGVE